MKKGGFSFWLHTFTGSDKNAGLLLLACAAFSLIITNLPFGENYSHFWHSAILNSVPAVSFTLEQGINEGLMAIFFLVVGLDIKRELVAGELYPLKKALLPFFAAIGGMLMPAFIYMLFNKNTATANGFGIPMGTDIAFALCVISLAGNRVPPAIKIILMAIAIIDDLGSVLIIALFYGSKIHVGYLAASLGMFLVLLVFNRLKFQKIIFYILGGLLMWFFMLRSGIHPTIAGVLLAFTLPMAAGNTSPALRLQQYLHGPVIIFILPVFTLANTAIPLSREFLSGLANPHALGIGLGLLIGKPLGIMGSFFILIKSGTVKMPYRITWRHVLAMGCVAGIGFTMSIFITQLAFTDTMLIQSSKLMILLASCIAGITGFLLFSSAEKANR